MICEYFGKCGSCTLGGISYDEQLNIKFKKEQNRFLDMWNKDIALIKSSDDSFRNRAEFRVWKIYDEQNNYTLHFAMNDIDKKILPIKNCSIVSQAIAKTMDKIIPLLEQNTILNHKLFSCEFLSSTTNDILVTLIYHKKLDNSWEIEARNLQEQLNIKIIGRSRKQKIILDTDTIDDLLTIQNRTYHFRYKEGGFIQPNQKVNVQMISWVLDNMDQDNTKDLCELYCGGGNFTIALSTKFRKVIATEISKTSIKSAKINCELNNITNIDFIRMSSEEFVEAKNKVRKFTRLKDIDLDSYDFSTIFLDPPRAGLDQTTTTLAKEFNQIIYISCNPETLHRDLEQLLKTHSIVSFALFDQFAYSNHIESGVILKKN
jgi:tRNA (uracil-5-)-methyltransferase